MQGTRPNTRKIINDPVYGFIHIPNDLVFKVIEHPWFQRLRRIKQLGFTHLVYPGALHTRFHHSLGAMFLMQEAINTLKRKGHKIKREEKLGATLAILLHDIGHGPFSHALEKTILKNISHEDISKFIMEMLNIEFEGALQTGISIFNKSHEKKFLSQLVSSQLDMDRLDYLTRDSFFTGVSEGIVGTQRIIKMLNVADGNLLVDAKGIYSIEKFLVARRIMYWQVYLHKTVLAAETMLINIFKRAKQLTQSGIQLNASEPLLFFLKDDYDIYDLMHNRDVLHKYTALDDVDVFAAIKHWTQSKDKILNYLCRSIVNRKLFRCEIQPEPFEYFYLEQIRQNVMDQFNLSNEESGYLFTGDTTSNYAYDFDSEKINVLQKNNKIVELTEASDLFGNFTHSPIVVKHFICYPKDVNK